MALLHYLKYHCGEYNITLSALNLDHGIRGEESARDSAFVKNWCAENDIPLLFYKAEMHFSDEGAARFWRLCQYNHVITAGKADLVATAHHMNDNAETVLFNLARGSGLSGATGIQDSRVLGIVRPLLGCTRQEIDEYIKDNNILFVTDSTNLTDDYTRNKIRHNVIPALEEAVPGAVRAIYRFSRLAAEDDEYLTKKAKKLIVSRDFGGYFIKRCAERVIFKRAVLHIFSLNNVKDYTSEHLSRLFDLQSAENGKRFCFLGFTAFKEDGGISLIPDGALVAEREGFPFYENLGCDQITAYGNVLACAEYGECADETEKEFKKARAARKIKTLKFDLDKIPQGAVIRFMRDGDKFKKFGGGTKSLGDFFTDKKIPLALRKKIPLVCDDKNVLIVGGVEISDDVKISERTKSTAAFICFDYTKQT